MSLKPKDTVPKHNFLSANYKELLAAILGVVAFYFVVRFGIHAIDPAAGTTDFGAIDILIFAFSALLLALSFVWMVLRIAFKTFHRYLDGKQFRSEFFSDAFGPRNRIYATLGVVFALLWLITKFAGLAAGVK